VPQKTSPAVPRNITRCHV